MYILFGVHSTSQICGFLSFAEFGKFSVIVSLNTLSVPLSFPSHYCKMLDLSLLFYRSLKYFSLLFSLLFILNKLY